MQGMMTPAKEPLLSKTAPVVQSLQERFLSEPVVQSLQGRFLSEPYYREKLTGFRKYDPSTWRSTLTINATSPFLAIPFTALIVFTFLLTVMSKLIPGTAPLVALGPQVHTVLGAALSSSWSSERTPPTAGGGRRGSYGAL